MFTKLKVAFAPAIAILGLGVIFSGHAMANMPPPDRDSFMPLQAIHDKLNLDAAQEKAWQGLAQKTRSMREMGRNEHGEMMARLKQELDKEAPDFAALAAKSDQSIDQRTAERRHVRDEWLKLYETLSPAQKTIVRDEMKSRLAKADKRRERMMQKWDKSDRR